MASISTDWTSLKNFVNERKLSIQWLDINENYYLFAYDGQFSISSLLPKASPVSSDQEDFESNYKEKGNVSPNAVVTTQYEMNNKDLKLARATASVGGDGKAYVSLKIPGEFGTAEGRYIAGGYGISEDYDKDDFVTVRVEDTDRLIALVVAKSMDSEATTPLTDEQMQSLGDFPSYPVVKSYTDDDCDIENQGWYFWANALGNSLSPVGEVEIEPIGGYGFVPSGMYLKLDYVRATKTTGSFRVNFYWGKLE